MTIEGIRGYLTTTLPMAVSAQQHFRLLVAVFGLAFASTVIIHLLIQEDDSLPGMLVHAAMIGLTYAIGVGLASAMFYLLRNARRHLRVWHVWFASLAGYILGFYFLPLDELMFFFQGGGGSHDSSMGFLQLFPVWFLVTYLFVQPYLNEGLKSELARLREINQLLEKLGTSERRTTPQLIQFKSGRTEFALDAAKIRNIVVEDHYCYVHFKHQDGYAKRDLAMPLRDVQALLPPDFLQVHRSHIVNLQHIASIHRKKRSIHVVLNGGYEVPVSRHRLDEVFPLLQERIAPFTA